MNRRVLLPFTAAPCLLFAACTLTGQTAKSTTVHHTSAGSKSSTAGGSCATDLPVLSPKIPALPAGSPCPRALFTVSSIPNIHIDYLSPLESATSLEETLGIQHNVITLDAVDYKTGSGELFSGGHKWLTINYTGYLVDGTKFDSSFDHPDKFAFPYGAHRVVLGWDTGFAGMRVGGKRRLFIPWQLGYGPKQHDQIPPASMMIFDVELMAITDNDPTPPKAAPVPQQPRPNPTPATPSVKQPPAAPPTTPPSPSADPTKPTTVPPPATSPKP